VDDCEGEDETSSMTHSIASPDIALFCWYILVENRIPLTLHSGKIVERTHNSKTVTLQKAPHSGILPRGPAAKSSSGQL